MKRGRAIDVVYGSALWHSATKVNCHFVTERLAEHVPVLYVESVGARLPGAHEWRRTIPRLLRSLRPVRRAGEQLWVCSPLPLPVYRGRGAALNSQWVGSQVRLLIGLLGWQPAMCWIFHPMGLGVATQSRPRGLAYYCVDNYMMNPAVDRQAMAALERKLLGRADVTLTTGIPLAERLQSATVQVRVLPNVADTDLFLRTDITESHPVLDALDAMPRPRVGYIGNLAAYKIDLALLREIAERRPQWTIPLV
ncbi:MAG: hypothetical protein OER90_14095, partial [Gemmatimonadota bacterium]|nr:hypothetical protein [Gemmatimonadota bacterium]